MKIPVSDRTEKGIPSLFIPYEMSWRMASVPPPATPRRDRHIPRWICSRMMRVTTRILPSRTIMATMPMIPARTDPSHIIIHVASVMMDPFCPAGRCRFISTLEKYKSRGRGSNPRSLTYVVSAFPLSYPCLSTGYRILQKGDCVKMSALGADLWSDRGLSDKISGWTP